MRNGELHIDTNRTRREVGKAGGMVRIPDEEEPRVEMPRPKEDGGRDQGKGPMRIEEEEDFHVEMPQPNQSLYFQGQAERIYELDLEVKAWPVLDRSSCAWSCSMCRVI